MTSTETATGAENPEFEAWTTEQSAAFLNIAVRTLQTWRTSGTLPESCYPRTVPGVRRLRWPAAALRQFAQGRHPTQEDDHA